MSETLAPFAAFIDAHYGGMENYQSEPTSVVRAVRAAFLAGYRAGIATAVSSQT